MQSHKNRPLKLKKLFSQHFKKLEMKSDKEKPSQTYKIKNQLELKLTLL
jgi:hypothetical protein